MIAVNAAHADLLASLRPLVMVELMTITLSDGQVLRYCNAPVALSYGGNTYQPLSWERGEVSTNIGLEVDEVDMTVYPKVYPVSAISEGQQDTILGFTWPEAVRKRLLDGAEFVLERGDINPLAGPDILGTLWMFSGQMSEPSYDDGLKFKIKSDLEVLNRLIPRQMYQPGCPYILFDLDDPTVVRCGLNADDWVEAGAITDATSTKNVLYTGLAQADGYFTLGKVEFVSGLNTGYRRTIKSHASGVLTLAGSLPYDVSVGDAILAWPGCDKQKATCNDKFSNTVLVNGVTVLRYGGQMYVPKPETAL